MIKAEVIDLGEWRLTPELQEKIAQAKREKGPTKPRIRIKTDGFFVILRPRSWALQFEAASTWNVALCIIFLHWKNEGRPFPLTNVALQEFGVSKRQKGRALRELERRELIKVEFRHNRNPIIAGCLL